MKRILLLLLLLTSGSAYAQKLPDIGLNKVHITEGDKTIVAEIYPLGSNPKVKADLYYYWCNANMIHSTQGGFSGTLLNGHYTEYYLNKNLKEQGAFKKGLKDGIWKTWSEDGTLNQASIWKDGLIVSETPISFWKKLNVFKRRAKRPVSGSLSKPTK